MLSFIDLICLSASKEPIQKSTEHYTKANCDMSFIDDSRCMNVIS